MRDTSTYHSQFLLGVYICFLQSNRLSSLTFVRELQKRCLDLELRLNTFIFRLFGALINLARKKRNPFDNYIKSRALKILLENTCFAFDRNFSSSRFRVLSASTAALRDASSSAAFKASSSALRLRSDSRMSSMYLARASRALLTRLSGMVMLYVDTFLAAKKLLARRSARRLLSTISKIRNDNDD